MGSVGGGGSACALAGDLGMIRMWRWWRSFFLEVDTGVGGPFDRERFFDTNSV